ncbi:PH domain-containing protein [Patescibacteria group bacterium]|nr:PH domain-containing protein [Patescibacteria group bacterium]
MLYILTCAIVTNKRLIRIETKGFFKYERAEAELNKIQDISVKIEGIFPAFLNFGDLEIQTAGTIVKLTFPQLPNPQKIKEIIMGLPR